MDLELRGNSLIAGTKSFGHRKYKTALLPPPNLTNSLNPMPGTDV